MCVKICYSHIIYNIVYYIYIDCVKNRHVHNTRFRHGIKVVAGQSFFSHREIRDENDFVVLSRRRIVAVCVYVTRRAYTYIKRTSAGCLEKRRRLYDENYKDACGPAAHVRTDSKYCKSSLGVRGVRSTCTLL